MKALLLLTSLLVSFVYFSDKEKVQVTAKYECLTTSGNLAKCTGSSSCRACKTCAYCAHCNNGGSCGVCSGKASQNFYNTSPTKTNTSTKSNSEVKHQNTDKGIYFYVANTTLNLREGPGTNYKIVASLSKNQKLLLLEAKTDWLKVRVVETEKVGWVYYKYVK